MFLRVIFLFLISMFTINAHSIAHKNYTSMAHKSYSEDLIQTDKVPQKIIDEQVEILVNDEGIKQLSIELLMDSKIIAQNLIKTWFAAEKFLEDTYFVADSGDVESLQRIAETARENLLEVLIFIPEPTVKFVFNSYLEERTSKSFDVYNFIMHPIEE